MQLRQTKDNLMNRFNYYLARLHGSQQLEGKYYGELKETIVLVFFNVNLIDNDRMCNTFTLRNEDGLSFVKETEDRMKICTIEMAKLDVEKSLEEMNEQEKMIYYFLNCHKGVMIESDGMIQMLEKRVETISDDGWKKIIEDFRKLHENEERMERQLQLEELQKVKEELQKAQEEACKEKEEARKVQQETARILDESDKKVHQMNQEIKKMIQIMLSNGMSLEFVSKSLSKSEDEILDLLK